MPGLSGCPCRMINKGIIVLHICVALAQASGWVKYVNHDLRISSHYLLTFDTYSADNCANVCTARSSEINIAKYTSRAVCVAVVYNFVSIINICIIPMQVIKWVTMFA